MALLNRRTGCIAAAVPLRAPLIHYPGANSFSRKKGSPRLDLHPTAKPIALVTGSARNCSPASVRRNRIPFNRPCLFEEHVSEVRDREGQQLCLLFLGSKKNKVDKAFGHSRCQVGKIDLLLPLDVLLNQFIDFAVQTALR